MAQEMIKKEFNIDIEIEFIEKGNLDKRLTELGKLYGKVDDFGGFFSPETNRR